MLPGEINFISRSSSNILKLIAAFLIVLHHYCQYLCANNISDNFIVKFFAAFVGYIVVSLFFFLSGYGLSESENKRKSDTFISFARRRLISVYFPFIIINLITLFSYQVLNIKHYTLIEAINNITGISLIDSVTWFVRIILLFYIFFYISYKMDSKRLRIIVLSLFTIAYILICIFNNYFPTMYVTILAFPIGVITSVYKNNIQNIKLDHKFIITCLLVYTLTLLLIIILYKYKFTNTVNMLISVLAIPIFITILRIIDKISFVKALSVGSVSYIIYLVHNKIFTIYKWIDNNISLSLYLTLVIIISILLEVIIKKLTSFLFKSSSKQQ